MIELVRDKRQARGVRQRALFWLAQSEDDAALRFLESVIVGDAGDG